MLRNKRFLSLFLSLALIIGVFAVLVPGVAFADGDEIVELTILGTTDLHGNIYDWSYEDGKEDGKIGLAKVYSVVKEAREKNPNTILIDNGDTIQGSIVTDEVYASRRDEADPMIDLMNFMKYDAMTLGNHEFNFGLDVVKKINKEANFPLISANIKYKEDDSHLVLPYTIVERSGVKVGVIGLTTPEIPKWDGSKVTDLKFENMAEAAGRTIEEIKDQVDIIIATSHSHYDDDRKEYDAKEIIEKNPEIAALLVGHSHATVSEKVGNVPVGGARNEGRQVVKFDLKLKKDKDAWTVEESAVEIVEVEEYEASEELKEYAKRYHDSTIEYISEVIGSASGDFVPEQEIKGIPEGQIKDTAVMDLINNIQLKAAGADVSAAALFQSSSNIKAGDITYASIFNIYKYPNTLYGVKVSGEELKDYMEWSVQYYNNFVDGDINISFDENVRSYKYDMFQGVDYKIDLSKAVGERIVDAKIDGKSIGEMDEIKLVINDYRFSGIKDDGILSEDNEVYFESDPKSVRAYIAEYIKEEGTIDPLVDKNWEIIGVDLNHPLRDYIIGEINGEKIVLPKSEDGRTDNVKGLNVYEMIKEGLIPQEVLKEHGIELEEVVEEIEVEETAEEVPVEEDIVEGPEVVESEVALKKYTVKADDVLWKIARMFKTTWEKLAEINKLKNPHLIFTNQELLVPEL